MECSRCITIARGQHQRPAAASPRVLFANQNGEEALSLRIQCLSLLLMLSHTCKVFRATRRRKATPAAHLSHYVLLKQWYTLRHLTLPVWSHDTARRTQTLPREAKVGGFVIHLSGDLLMYSTILASSCGLAPGLDSFVT